MQHAKLRLDPSAQLAGPAGSEVAIDSGGELESAAGSFSAARVTVGDGRLRIAPNATLAAAVDNRGGTVEGAGTVKGTLRNGGEVSPTGDLTVDGAYEQTQSGTLRIDAGSDRLRVTGAATLAGTLVVELPPGFDPPADGLQIMSFASRTGELAVDAEAASP